MTEIWYRVEAKRYANYDPWAEFEQPSGSHLKLNLQEYKVIRHTPKGVVVLDGRERFVLGNSLRQLCVPTKEAAYNDLVCRQEKYIRIREARIKDAKEAIRAAKRAITK